MKARKSGSSSDPSAGPVRIGEVMPQLIVKYGLQQRRSVERLAEAWKEAVGDPFAAVTRVVGLSRGTLEIAVTHSAFIQELSFRRTELLAAMKTALADETIRKIKFVTG